MDSRQYRDLMEAYVEVYASQEEIDEATAMAKRGYDEAPIRQKIAKSTGGGKSADRASDLENRPTYGDANKAKQRQNYARKQRGDFRSTTSSSPGLHGYAHKSDDAGVKAKQAARGAQRGALTPAEKKSLNREEFDLFDTILEFLYVEGYVDTLEEAEWMMANLIDEEAIDIILEASCEDDDEDEKEMKKGKKSKKSEEDEEDENEEELEEASYSAKAARAGKDIGKPGKQFAKIAKEAGKRYGSKERGEKVAGAVLAKLRKEDFEAWLDEAMTKYERNRKRAAQRAAARNAARDQGKTGAVPGVGYVTPRRERETWTDESGKTRHAKGL